MLAQIFVVLLDVLAPIPIPWFAPQTLGKGPSLQQHRAGLPWHNLLKPNCPSPEILAEAAT
ncbi:hypothetical protein KC19_2G022500 [Ceratodon purpureus]|uniref:Uncharacterized protein n=1 Tax=Ceratodon purpureus TaxID=3225 RepID=A0A8T0IP90_CERPU|nr:hypothetical protein KC19_2G022500 [Ceratodon purpureus]